MSKKELPVLQAPACCTPLVREPLTEDDARSLAAVFKALSDPVRLRLLSLIASFEGGEACVCDLTGPFDVSQPTISHHLRVLREAGLIEGERRATWVYYRVLPDGLARLGTLLATDSAAAQARSAVLTAPAAPDAQAAHAAPAIPETLAVPSKR